MGAGPLTGRFAGALAGHGGGVVLVRDAPVEHVFVMTYGLSGSSRLVLLVATIGIENREQHSGFGASAHGS